MMLQESSPGILDRQKDEWAGPTANEAGNIAGGRNDRTEATLLCHIMRSQGYTEKIIMLGKIEGSGKHQI